MKYAFLGPLREPVRGIYKSYKNRRRLRQWRSIVRASRDLSRFAALPKGPRIVHLPMIGHSFLVNIELMLGAALAGRGARVEQIFDDITLPLCELTTGDVVESGRKDDFCRNCVRNMRAMTEGLPHRIRYVSEFVSPGDLAEFSKRAAAVGLDGILAYRENGVPIGRPAMMVALRYFRKGMIGDSPGELDVVRKYMVSAMISQQIAEKLCREGEIHAAMSSHGIYSSWEPALETFKARGVPVAVYDRQTGIDRYQFNWNVSPNTGDMSSAWARTWHDRKLTEDERRAALRYIADRETFKNEAAKFSSVPPQDPGELRRQLGVPENRTALLLVSNLVWDAAAAGRDLIFANTVEWVCKTIESVSRRPESLHLIIKPHPAEVMRGTKLFVAEEVREVYKDLPGNVTVLSADAKVNPQSLMKAVDVGIAHTSTAGLEMAALGKPVIPVSLAHYRGKGFTFDPGNLEEYQALLARADSLPARYTTEMKELALKYVFVRYFKYQVELPLLREKGFLGCVGYRIESLDDLLPGRFPDLDFVCDGILNRRADFVKD